MRAIDACEAQRIADAELPINESGIVQYVLSHTPTLDVVPVVHARWEKVGKHDWRCSACKIGVPYSFTGFSYCHNCGAKMDLKE